MGNEVWNDTKIKQNFYFWVLFPFNTAYVILLHMSSGVVLSFVKHLCVPNDLNTELSEEIHNRLLCVTGLVNCGGTGGMLRACNTDPFLTQDLMEADEKRGGAS